MEFNQHNKQEYPPMHTAEHILNGTMVRMFGWPISFSAHIERKEVEMRLPPATPLIRKVSFAGGGCGECRHRAGASCDNRSGASGGCG